MVMGGDESARYTWLIKMEYRITRALIERIWNEANDSQQYNICNEESVYQILSDNAYEWRGPRWRRNYVT